MPLWDPSSLLGNAMSWSAKLPPHSLHQCVTLAHLPPIGRECAAAVAVNKERSPMYFGRWADVVFTDTDRLMCLQNCSTCDKLCYKYHNINSDNSPDKVLNSIVTAWWRMYMRWWTTFLCSFSALWLPNDREQTSHLKSAESAGAAGRRLGFRPDWWHAGSSLPGCFCFTCRRRKLLPANCLLQ